MNVLHFIEIIIIIGIIFLQFKAFRSIYRKIKELKDLDLHDVDVRSFSYPSEYLHSIKFESFRRKIEAAISDPENIESNIDNGDVSASVLYSKNQMVSTQKIIKEINTYMLKNDRHLINFDIIRDITNRNFQVLDDDINQSLPTPLYLGLAATMLGIIIGLGGMAISHGDMSDNITSLIIGVGIAMTSSLIGLGITTYLSTWVYKYSKREADEEKNEFFSKLQAELLPELIRQGESGIDGLKNELSRFGKLSMKLVKELTSSSKDSTQSLSKQHEIIERIERLDVLKISNTSIEIFKRLEKNLKTFEKFSAYWERLNSSLLSTNELVQSLKSLVSKFDNIDEVADSIKATLNDYNVTMRFFTEHIEGIKDIGGLSRKAVTDADVAFKNAISELEKSTLEKISGLTKTKTNLDVFIKEIGTNVADSLEKATEAHLKELANVYSTNMPEFEKLSQLDNLVLIKESIVENALEMNSSRTVQSADISKKLENLEGQIANLSSVLDKKLTNSTMIHSEHEKVEIPTKLSKKDKFYSNIDTGLRFTAFSVVIIYGLYALIKELFFSR
ncbi:MAG: hypothetical protein ACJA2M_000174 [Polaribacter sp.]|jgi:hypothetical protein